MRRVIVNFHGLGSPARNLEPGEARYWVKPDLLRAALDLARDHAGEVEVSFTFDDGNASDLTEAAPLLAAAGVSAGFFVLADRLGAPGSLDAAGMRALQAAGHRIGSHGAGHVDWRGLDPTGRQREFQTARDRIAQALGEAVTEAAIPFGRYDRRVLQGLRAMGYTRAYSSDGGAWGAGDWPIPRSSPTAEMGRADLEAIVLGRESLTRKLRRAVSRRVKARL